MENLFNLPLEILALLVCAAFIAGFIDSIAGGGGLITVPALLLAGLPPATAIATNKVQAVFGSGSATYHFARAKMIDWRDARTGFYGALLGSGSGAFVIQFIDAGFLNDLMPVLLILVAFYFAFAPNLNDEPRKQLMSANYHGATVGTGIGFYDGIFGPGTGSFLAASYVTLLGYGIRKATAHAKLLNFASNAGSLVVFLFGGKIMIALGLLMACGQFLGATLGARTAIKHGGRVIRPLLVIMCCAMAVKLLLS